MADALRGLGGEPEVVMREHDRLGRARRAAGVDQRREAVRLQRAQPRVDFGIGHPVAAGEEFLPLAEEDQRHPRSGKFFGLRRVGNDRDSRLRVPRDVLRLLGGQRRIDGRRHRAGRDRAEIGLHPLGQIRPDDADRLAGLHPERDQCARRPAHDLRRLPPGKFANAVFPGQPRSQPRRRREEALDGCHCRQRSRVLRSRRPRSPPWHAGRSRRRRS